MGADVVPQVWTHPGDDVYGSVEVNRAIGAGVGVIMVQRGLSYEEAAGLLRELSQQDRRSLFALAQEMIAACATARA
jgi:AmiR/NasT family two-component response regulator